MKVGFNFKAMNTSLKIHLTAPLEFVGEGGRGEVLVLIVGEFLGWQERRGEVFGELWMGKRIQRCPCSCCWQVHRGRGRGDVLILVVSELWENGQRRGPNSHGLQVFNKVGG